MRQEFKKMVYIDERWWVNNNLTHKSCYQSEEVMKYQTTELKQRAPSQAEKE